MGAEKINDFITCAIIGIGIILLLGGFLDSLLGEKPSTRYYDEGLGTEQYMDWRDEMR